MPDHNPNDHMNKAGQATVDESARAARLMTDQAMKATEHYGQTTAEAGKTAAEIVKASLAAGADTAARSLDSMRDHLSSSMGFVGPNSENLAQRHRQNIEAMSQAGAAMIKGVDDMTRQMVTFAKDRLVTQIDAFNRVTQCRSVHDLVTAQSDLMRQGLEQSIESSRRIAEICAKATSEAATRIQHSHAA